MSSPELCGKALFQKRQYGTCGYMPQKDGIKKETYEGCKAGMAEGMVLIMHELANVKFYSRKPQVRTEHQCAASGEFVEAECMGSCYLSGVCSLFHCVTAIGLIGRLCVT